MWGLYDVVDGVGGTVGLLVDLCDLRVGGIAVNLRTTAHAVALKHDLTAVLGLIILVGSQCLPVMQHDGVIVEDILEMGSELVGRQSTDGV